MAEYFMGQELIQGELPANSPKPAETPPEGIIMTDVSGDGWQRRYIYIAMAGAAPEEILISETPPASTRRISGAAVAVEEVPMEIEGAEADVPIGIMMPEGAILPENAVFSGLPGEPLRIPAPTMGGYRMAPAAGTPLRTAMPAHSPQMAGVQMAPAHSPMAVPTVSIQKSAPPPPLMVQGGGSPVPGGQVMMPFTQGPIERAPQVTGSVKLSNGLDSIKPVSVAPIADMHRSVQERPLPMLGQGARSLPLTTQEAKRDLYPINNPIVQNQPIAAGMAQMGGSPAGFAQNQIPLRQLGQAAPTTPEPTTGGKCPGAVEMPDGTTIQPDQFITLAALCELVPFLVETIKGLVPGQKIPVVGQKADGRTAVPTQGGPYGRASAGGFGVGGGGGAPGAPGPAGPAGPTGATGPGSIVEPPVVKVDGDFIAGPGAFVPVPGTTVPFTLATAGVAEVKALLTLGSGATQLCESVQIGIRIDGTDYPLTVRLLATFAANVGEFHIGQCFTFPITLGPGPHTAELLLRGLLPGEFGGGLGTAAAVNANPAIPLIMTVSHN